ncbi:MAG: histidinol-phosphate transaminase [Cryobacterium sp.]|nr:histidinol-phosphate transaminase [Cryobacterium sp.]
MALRPEILATAPYRQGRPAPTSSFKLSSNENPFEPLPAVIEAINSPSINRYPDATAAAVAARIAAKFGVTPGEVHVGAGSVSILAQLIQAAAAPGDEVLYSWRSFEAYPGLVTVAGATSVQVPNTADHGHDLPAMTAAVTDRTRAIIVCSPNNPTGTVVSQAEFERFMATVPATVLVMLDEAYIEFVTDSDAANGERLLGRYPNLVILRTFSKAYGLAGLRIGYAIGPEYILDAARATAIPLSVTEQAQRGALASLDHEAELLERVAVIAARRDEAWHAATEAGLDVPRSQSNFLWLATEDRTVEVNEVLLKHGIVARVLGGDGIRVSIGEAESVEKLVVAAREVVANLQS